MKYIKTKLFNRSPFIISPVMTQRNVKDNYSYLTLADEKGKYRLDEPGWYLGRRKWTTDSRYHPTELTYVDDDEGYYLQKEGSQFYVTKVTKDAKNPEKTKMGIKHPIDIINHNSGTRITGIMHISGPRDIPIFIIMYHRIFAREVIISFDVYRNPTPRTYHLMNRMDKARVLFLLLVWKRLRQRYGIEKNLLTTILRFVCV